MKIMSIFNNYEHKFKEGDLIISDDLKTMAMILATPEEVRSIGMQYRDHYRVAIWTRGVKAGSSPTMRTIMYRKYIDGHLTLS